MKVMTATRNMSADLLEAFPDLVIEGDPEKVSEFDLVILTGGSDINPSYYRESPNGAVGWSDERDDKEYKVLVSAVAQNSKTKILGICRGAQFLNIVYGGTLIQDLGDVNQWHNNIHPLKHLQPNPLDWLKEVNSLHHQALTNLPFGSTTLAVHPEYHTPEIVAWGNKALGVQFHPEMFGEEKYTRFFDLIKDWVNGRINFSKISEKTSMRRKSQFEVSANQSALENATRNWLLDVEFITTSLEESEEERG